MIYAAWASFENEHWGDRKDMGRKEQEVKRRCFWKASMKRFGGCLCCRTEVGGFRSLPEEDYCYVDEEQGGHPL